MNSMHSKIQRIIDAHALQSVEVEFIDGDTPAVSPIPTDFSNYTGNNMAQAEIERLLTQDHDGPAKTVRGIKRDYWDKSGNHRFYRNLLKRDAEGEPPYVHSPNSNPEGRTDIPSDGWEAELLSHFPDGAVLEITAVQVGQAEGRWQYHSPHTYGMVDSEGNHLHAVTKVIPGTHLNEGDGNTHPIVQVCACGSRRDMAAGTAVTGWQPFKEESQRC